jgi:hypothetical protein
MPHDQRLVTDESQIETLRDTIPDWIKRLERPNTPCIAPAFGCEGTLYGHTGNRAPGFQPYDTFKCSDGWVYIGALGGAIYDRIPKFLGLDPVVTKHPKCAHPSAELRL